MKFRKKKILNLANDNKNIILGLCIIIFVFSLCLLPLIGKGTYSTGETEDVSADSLVMTCDEKVAVGTEFQCSIVLNSVTMTAQGISAKFAFSEEMEYVSFVANDVFSNYDDTNVVDSDGFVLVSDGITGTVNVGTVTFKIHDTALSNEYYKVELNDVVIGDGNETEITLGNSYASVRVLSDINTLDDIELSVGTLNEEFDKDKNKYTSNVNSDKVVVSVIKTDENSVVNGDGVLELHYGTNSFEIVVTSESGKKKIYTLDIFREYDFTSETYRIEFDSSLNIDEENKYIKYLSVETTVNELLAKITLVGGSVKLFDALGNEKDNTDVLATGDVLTTYVNENVKDKYTLSIIGDPTGDGLLDLRDLGLMRRHIVGWKNPETQVIQRQTGVNFYALDFNEDNVIDLRDLGKMRRKIVGLE